MFLCRDPDPLSSIASSASSTQADRGASGTPDAHASAAAPPPGDVGFSTGNNSNDLDATTASVTPERISKRQRRLSSLKVEGGGGGSPAAASPAALSLLPPPPPPGATPTATSSAAASLAPAAGDPTGGAVAPAAGKDNSAPSPGSIFHKSMSFQADAPLPRGMSISGIVDEAETAKCGVAAAGGTEGSGEIWGGGALSRQLSEHATQVICW